MTLALIRHVTPLIDRGVCDAAEAARRAILYDATLSLALWQTDKFKSSAAYEKLARISRVCSSPLPRETALNFNLLPRLDSALDLFKNARDFYIFYA
ncbi:Uncharacterised protein [Campylobacter gracilis]|nr:Uncharacterised protein [Campylobacter gracilis]